MIRLVTVWFGRLPRVTLFALAAGAVGLFGAGISGGFDFSDEGFYYLSFVHPENVSDNQTSFYLFGAKIFALLGHSIVAMRLATLVALWSGTLIFLHGGRRFLAQFAPELQPDPEHRHLLLAAALVASLLGLAISPAALSYNFQNAFCLLAASGCLLTACARPRGAALLDRPTVTALAGFGAFTGLEFFVKFSSSVPLAGAGALLFFAVSRQSLRQKAALAGLLLLCAAASALVYFTCFQNFSHWWTGMYGTAWSILHGGYATGEISRYGREIAALYTATLLNFAPVWVVAVPGIAVVAALRAWPRWQGAVAALAGLWTLGHLLWLIDELEYFPVVGGASLAFFSGTLGLLALLAAGSRVAVRSSGQGCTPGRWRVAFALGLFFALPYLGACGTNNAIHLNCLYQLAPWFVLAAWLLAEIDRIWRTTWPSRAGLLLLAVMAASQFYQGYWLHPYRVPGTRAEQTEPTAIGDPASTLRLTPAVHEFVTTTRRILQEHGFQPGDDLLVFFNLPGFVFAMGGASPGHPWYYQNGHQAFELNLMRLRFVAPERLRRAFIVRNSANWDDFLPYLQQAGLKFPQDYQLITPPLTAPLGGLPFEIWAPVARNAPR